MLFEDTAALIGLAIALCGNVASYHLDRPEFDGVASLGISLVLGITAVDPAAPALTVGELSTQRGDGIFESIGVVDGHAQEVEAHLSRLAHSAQLCDLHVWRVGPGRYACILSLSTAQADAQPEDFKCLLRVHEELVHISVEVNHVPA